MSQLKLPEGLDEDIKLISDLDYVEIRKWTDSLYDVGVPFDDDSQGIQFEDSSQESHDLGHNFEVSLHINECPYAISKNKECVVSLRVELHEQLKHPYVEIIKTTNSSVQLRNSCEYYFNHVAFTRSSINGLSLYKLITDFHNFLQIDSRNAELQQMSEGSSVFEDQVMQSMAIKGGPRGSSQLFQYFSNNTYNDYYRKVNSYNGLFRNTTRYNSLTINRKDKIYAHLTTHSRYFREFKEEAVLGSGSFGCVTKVLKNGINYAVKQIPIYEHYESILHEEAAVLASLHHPNIVRYYDAWLEQSPEYLINKFNVQVVEEANEHNQQAEHRPSEAQTPTNFDDTYAANDVPSFNNLVPDDDLDENLNQMYNKQNDKNVVKFYNKHYKKRREKLPKKCLFILMEYCGEESLLETINKHTLHETPQKVIELFRQVMEALSYIHEKGIIHRDIKPSNIFMKFENEFLIKLGDFGLTAKLQQSKGDAGVRNENGLVGTLHYMAPEQLECDAHDEKVDIFSAGVVLFEMLSRPFTTFMERCEILSSFSTPDKQWPEGFRERVDHRLFKLLEAMLNVNPKKRPSASEILQNEVFSLNRLNLQSLYDVVTQYPHSMESVQLLNTIFSRKQQYKKLSDCYSTSVSNNVVDYVNSELGLIYDREFRSRNVLRVQLSLLTHMPTIKTDNEEASYADGPDRPNKADGSNKDRPEAKERAEIRESGRERAKDKDSEAIDRNRLLLNNGRCCYLRYSLLYSLAECMPTDLTTIMRRYAYVPVYAVSPVGSGVMGTARTEPKPDSKADSKGELRSLYYYLGYDILVDYLIILSENQEYERNLDAFFTYELISVCSRPLKRFIGCSLILEWSHSELISKIVAFLGLPDKLVAKVERLLMCDSVVKGRLPGLSDETSASLSALHPYLHKFRGRIAEFKRGLDAIINTNADSELLGYFRDLCYFERFLADFDGSFYFRPVYTVISSTGVAGGNGSAAYLNYDNINIEPIKQNIFEKYMFKMCLEIGKRNYGDFVFGGCYNKIVESYVTKRNAFGFEMNLQPIYEYFTQNIGQNSNLSVNMKFNLNYAPDVMVYTPQINLVAITTSLENRFWKLGLKCYKKVSGSINTKKIGRMKRLGLFSLQKLKYLITIKRSTEAHEVQYVLVDIDLENKEMFGGEDSVIEYVLHNINPS